MDLNCKVFHHILFFAGTLLDLPACILYTVIVSSIPDTSNIEKLEYLGYHFGSD